MAIQDEFIDHWREELEERREELTLFILDLKLKNPEYTDALSRRAHRKTFEEVDCLDCANCCKTTPPLVRARDIKRIAAHLKMPPATFRRKYVLEDVNGELSFSRIPCPFLENNNHCSIYAVRPWACRDYPHTEMPGFTKHTYLHRANLEICPAVMRVLDHMKEGLP